MKKNLLRDYHKKRDFKVTSEPKGRHSTSKKRKLTFVIQEHHARRLHYDFRLEWEGVLKSWAVPKGPSKNPADKRLAVQTEDHPLEYGKFHGTIPEGEYGAGEVFIWDNGIWEPEGDVEAGLRKGHLEFKLKGKKLNGKWMLVRTHYKETETKKNWLLIKRKDAAQEVEKNDDKWPGFIPPQLPRLVSAPPSESKWVHEMKFDGYRIQTHLQDGVARFFTRTGLDWSNTFPNLLESVGKLKAGNAILDGEIVALDKEGKANFQMLQNSLKSKNDKNLRYYIFDILYLDGRDLRELPLLERKEILAEVLKKIPSNLIYSEHFAEDGEDFYQATCDYKLEGMVSKLADAPYRSGRNDFWVKTKCTLRQELVIGGYTEAKGSRLGFGALLVGLYEDGKFRYAGKVGTGFTQKTLKDIKGTLKPLETEESPFEVNSPRGKGIHWVKPVKVAEIGFSNWTDEGVLRTPVFLGLREDKPSKDIHREKPKKLKKGLKELSSPEKILFKKEKITKEEVADFYQKISKVMLPYLSDRPLSIVRCPEGSEGSCFFQKHLGKNMSDAFISFPIMEDKGEGIYFSINSPQGLQELVQLNAFELHCWNCHRQKVMRPDQIVMDFDPGPGVPWNEVIRGAFELKSMLEDLGLVSFVKLTGGKGLHVHIPIAPLYDWEQVKSFAQTLALELVSSNPKKYTANMSKKLRKGKIFVDYLRNGYGATAVVPYSLRAKPLSAVAMPVEWSELSRIKDPQHFTMARALKKIKSRKRDPWEGMMKMKQKISILTPLKSSKAA